MAEEGLGRIRRVNFLDSDVLIEIQRLSPASQEWITSNASVPFMLPAPVAIEFLIGSRNRLELSRASSILSQFTIEWLSKSDSSLALDLVSQFRLTTGLGFADFHIAAQALNRGATLYTFNLKHFAAIPGLDARSPFMR